MFQTQPTQWLLLSGIGAATLFFLVATVEIFARPGFDISRHAVSMLSLGERGWLMIATFVVSGILTMAFATGLWQATGTWVGPVLFGLYGLGFVIAGVFPAPAGMGFPPGTPDDLMPTWDTGAVLHSVGFMLGFIALTIGSFFMAAHFGFAGAITIAVLCGIAGIAMPVLIALGMGNIVPPGIAFYFSGMLAWAVVALVAAHLATMPGS